MLDRDRDGMISIEELNAVYTKLYICGWVCLTILSSGLTKGTYLSLTNSLSREKNCFLETTL